MILKNHALLFSIILMAALLLQGCFSSSSHRRGKLSDAMEESSDEHEGKREVATEPEPEYDDDDEEYVSVRSSARNALAGSDTVAADSTRGHMGSNATWFTLALGSGLLKTGDFYGFNHGNLALGTFVADKHYLELSLGLSIAPVQETSLLSQSLDGGVTVLQIGLGYKYYLTPGHTFLGIYIPAGLGYAYMFWSYKNPFQAMAYDEQGNATGMETISGDGLSGFELYTGIGINLIQTESLQLGGEFLPGAILWGGSTSQGFDNDVFDNFTYTRLKISLRIGW